MAVVEHKAVEALADDGVRHGEDLVTFLSDAIVTKIDVSEFVVNSQQSP